MNSACNNTRTFSKRAVGAALVAAAVATRMPAASAFLTPFSSTNIKISTELFAADGTAEETNLRIETITDGNSQDLLNPPTSPERPVLVDAFAPCCGPCKLLDKVLRKAQPEYLDKVDFLRWDVTDKENTVELKKLVFEHFELKKLPTLIVFREGKPVAIRPGMTNEFQLDSFLEKTLPDVLEPTFDEDGVKIVPLPEETMVQKKEVVKEEISEVTHKAKSVEEELVVEMAAAIASDDKDDCTDPGKSKVLSSPSPFLSYLFLILFIFARMHTSQRNVGNA